MEQKSILISALGVGVGVGVGIGLASGQSVGNWGANTFSSNAITAEKMEQEMLRQVVDGRESNVTFDKFPYYLRHNTNNLCSLISNVFEQTRVLLTSAAYVHLKHAEVSKYTRNLAPASRTILLSGPAELYQQMLAKALAHYFEAKLLLLDLTDFSLKIQSKYGGSSNIESSFKRSTSETTLERLSDLFGSFSIFSQREEPKVKMNRPSSGVDLQSMGAEVSLNPPTLHRNASSSSNISGLASQTNPTNSVPLKRTTSWSFDEKILIESLHKVLAFVSKTYPIVLYLRDVDRLLYKSQRIYNLFQKMLKKLSGPILILGSRVIDSGNDYEEVDEKLNSLFPYNIEIRPPEDESHLVSWKSQLEEDMKMIQVQDNKNHIMEVLAATDLDCDDLDSICVADTMILSNYIEEIIVSAISYHLMKNKDTEYRNGKLVISSNSLSHALNIFHKGKSSRRDASKLEDHAVKSEQREEGTAMKPEVKSKNAAPVKKTEAEISTSVGKAGGEKSVPAPKAPEVPLDNEFEKQIRPEVIPANEIDVTFSDIGALDDTKESLQELVMLPLRRPDLFTGGLLKPCRGILLFGPPGTGKTMLAKAIAKEAGASFINVSMSTITSKWFGEDEKNVRALFTLAAKVSPTIIFLDEVDSMLGQRTRVGEHEAMRKIKNEFMTHWDGLLTKQGERILVLAATNRPFDLDEAIIRRFERRIMVELPSVENREKILRTLLAKEKVDNELDFKELATMTEGYTGSDLKNLCTTAAYRPVRELIQQERLKSLDKKQKAAKGQNKDVQESQGGQSILGNTQDAIDGEEEVKQERVITLGPLNMQDFKEAKNQVAASFAAEGAGMSEMKQWNDLYGEGGSRKQQQLSYFL
ncbi:putative AAA domain-containing protein C24B10.10c isoform A [Glycine soja]|uniref:Putative AAA domain-containing protein C24B10.10c isoform A n=2 Tax=Glycine soja TaxID=3848 RepID=A0A445KS33_GLYSO|nr:putative AAA domain-containing protein C24B10.10c isoform A [Glycine soja]